MAGVISTWRPVRCRFICASGWIGLPCCSSLDRLAQVRRLYVHGLPILGYGSSRDLDSLLREDVGDAVVRKGLPAVLGGHQLLDERADRSGRAGPAGIRRHMAAE